MLNFIFNNIDFYRYIDLMRQDTYNVPKTIIIS